jgi:positive regulator of sigma E activity
MNTQEKTLYYLSLLLIIISVGLRIFHVLNSSDAHLLMSLSFSLGFLAYGRYARRLKARNEELEQEVSSLRSAPF